MLDFRNHDSYVSLAGILLGAALPELISTLVVLLGRAESYKTTMWILSFYSATMLLIYMISQFLVLDFVASPYKVPEHFLGIMLMANYGFNLLVSVGISILFAYRIALFHGKRSAIALVFYGFCGLVICGKAIANAIGFKIGIDTYNLVYGLDYRSNPLYNLVPIGMSVAMSVEAVYSTVGSLVFLSFVTGKSNLKELGKADSAVIRRESFRIKLIALTNFLNLLLAVWVAFDDNFISHVAYCRF